MNLLQVGMLRPGDRFIMPGEDREYEVVTVSFSGALVRPVRRNRIRYRCRDGREITYLATPDSRVISANTIVDKLPRRKRSHGIRRTA